ncbi:type II secretion system F family protein [Aquisalibacillus elongatus]|uniref:Type IV pilus assembly protein PilC n=1 Tax=Aquisalibacillus elongatus TaxID=485577 RepID=A0A3N5BSU0_9BACI|nr:type II secretion system F family protein [Aquisalibacillus elongatus]RPF50562.1 type IV pilus assembly protein PilC [Aquisalibacillus elongatus]
MASYKYEAYDFYGTVKKGRLEAYNADQVKKMLKDEGYKVEIIEEVKDSIWTKEFSIGRPVKNRDMVIFLQQFSALLQAGMTIVDTIRILREQTKNKILDKALYYVEVDLRQGTSLANAMGKYAKVFPVILVNMIHSAEVSGTLEETLEDLAHYYEKQHKTLQKVRSSLAYPITVVFVAIAVVTFLLMYVVPQFVTMFNQFGGELPWITQTVLQMSELLKAHWLLLLLIVAALTLVFISLLKNDDVKYKIDHVLLKLPVFGPLILKTNIARMSRTLNSLLKNAVPIIDSIDLTRETIKNRVVNRVLQQSKSSLKQGGSFVKPMEEHWAFPFLVTQMISVGEKTGSLEDMLNQVANFYEEDVETTADQLKSLLEPLLIISLSIIVGTIVLAIVIPMFDLYSQI